MKENRFIQAMILIVFHSSYFSRRSSNKFFSTAIAKISFTGFSSARDSTVETVVMSSGQSCCLDSHSGPFSHNCVDSVNFTASATQICWVFFSISVSPLDICLFQNLFHTIPNELLILAPFFQPM